MKIVNDNRISDKYKGFSRQLNLITCIVIHGTGGGSSAKAIIDWMSSDNCERKNFYLKGIGLFHFEIDLNGDIYPILSVEQWAYHSDAGAWDMHTIGIEMLNTGINNSEKYTDEQYNALFELISNLIETYPSINEIRSHDANRRILSGMPKKPCPGDRFNWEKLEQNISDNINQSMTITRA